MAKMFSALMFRPRVTEWRSESEKKSFPLSEKEGEEAPREVAPAKKLISLNCAM
jgi:hypothetical protein